MGITRTISLDQIKFPGPKEYSLKKHGITQSMLSNINCPMKMAIALNRLRNSESEYKFVFGDMSHWVTEAMYKRFQKTGKKPGPKFIASRYNKYIETERKRWKTIDQETIDLYSVRGNALLNCYVEYWAADFKKINYVEIEKTFGVKFFGTVLRGKRDIVFKRKGQLWIEDHKFYSQINSDLLDILIMDFQTKFYYLAFKLEYGKYPAGIIYNVVRKPGIKPKKDENLVEYQERLAEEIRSKPTYYFQRFQIEVDEKTMEQFEFGLKTKITTLIGLLSGALPLVKNEFECFKKFTCDHLEGCNQNKLRNYTKGKRLFPELTDLKL